MEITFPVFKYFIILILVVAWIYFRLLRSKKKRGEKHGRELWRNSFRKRREESVKGAQTWDERRRLVSEADPQLGIASRFLQGARGEKTPEGGEKERRGGGKNLDGDEKEP